MKNGEVSRNSGVKGAKCFMAPEFMKDSKKADKVKDMEEGLVENLEEVLEEFGQSPQKPCPKPIGPFQGHP